MYKGITPTFTLTLPENINLGAAEAVLVTFATRNGNTLLSKGGDDLDIQGNVVSVFLTQEETLAFPTGRVLVQVNWTYLDGTITKRACTDIASVYWTPNLVNEVME